MVMATAGEYRESVELGGQLLPFDVVVRYMDPALLFEAAEWAGYGATAQAVLDAYLPLHEARHGAPFAGEGR